MHELLNVRTNKIIVFPSDIDELNPRQWLCYVSLMLSLDAGKISIPAFKHRLFMVVTGLKVSWKINWYSKAVQQQIWSAVSQKVELVSSFFDIESRDNNSCYSPHWQCGKNLLPVYKGYVGPADMLSNITWGQFSNCIKSLYALSKADNDADNDKLPVIVNYIFNQLYKANGHRFLRRHIPYVVKYSAFLFFRSVYELITTTPIPVNGEDIDFSILFKSEKSGSGDKTGWDGLRLSIAGAGVFGTLNQSDEQLLWDVLLFMYKSEIERREMDKQLKNNRQNG